LAYFSGLNFRAYAPNGPFFSRKIFENPEKSQKKKTKIPKNHPKKKTQILKKHQKKNKNLDKNKKNTTNPHKTLVISVGGSTWSEARHLCRSGSPGDGEAGRRDAARGQGLSLMGKTWKTLVIFTKNQSCVKMFIDF
jgi:hypothetical protein